MFPCAPSLHTHTHTHPTSTHLGTSIRIRLREPLPGSFLTCSFIVMGGDEEKEMAPAPQCPPLKTWGQRGEGSRHWLSRMFRTQAWGMFFPASAGLNFQGFWGLGWGDLLQGKQAFVSRVGTPAPETEGYSLAGDGGAAIWGGGSLDQHLPPFVRFTEVAVIFCNPDNVFPSCHCLRVFNPPPSPRCKADFVWPLGTEKPPPLPFSSQPQNPF